MLAQVALLVAAAALLCSLLARSAAAGAPLHDADLFVGGEGGYACYRLPNLVQLPAAGHISRGRV